MQLVMLLWLLLKRFACPTTHEKVLLIDLPVHLQDGELLQPFKEEDLRPSAADPPSTPVKPSNFILDNVYCHWAPAAAVCA